MSEVAPQAPDVLLSIPSTVRTTSLRAPRVAGLRHVPALDGLRAVAILAVVGYHAGLLPGGYLGVDVFFVLSGFLITSILMREHEASGTIALGRFWARRALRLLPELCVLVSALWIYAAVFQDGDKAAAMYSDGIIALLYVGNWVQAFTADRLGFLGHTWSLAIEEQFYALWPLVLLALLSARVPRRRVLALTVGAAVLSMLLRLALYWGDWPLPRLYYASDTRADGVLLGCALALSLAPVAQRLPRSLTLTAAAVLVAAVSLVPFSAASLVGGPLTLVYLATGTLIAHVVADPLHWLARALSSPPMAWLGRISYGLYLWHFPAIILCRYKLDLPWVTQTIAALALALAVAAASYYVVAVPCLRAKQWLRATR